MNILDPPLPLHRLLAPRQKRALELRGAGATAYSANARTAIREVPDILGLKPGDEVLMPAYNCGSEVDPLLKAGLTVSMYEVDRAARIDLDDLAARIAPATKAIYLTHFFGFVREDELRAVRAICDAHSLFLIEDRALALLNERRPGAAAPLGNVVIYCFYKFFPVIGGGAIVARRGELAVKDHLPRGASWKSVIVPVAKALLRAARLGGLVRRNRGGGAGAARFADGPEMREDTPHHYYFDDRHRGRRISAVTARLLRTFDADEAVERRRRNYSRLAGRLARIEGVGLLYPELTADAVPLSFPIVVDRRDAFNEILNARGVPAVRWWAGYHSALAWADYDGARYLKDHVVSLPCHPYLTDAELDHVARSCEAAAASLRGEERGIGD